MTPADSPRILLLGAGHANLLAVRALRDAIPRARITLIDAAAQASYSGIFPRNIAGNYTLDEIRVDLSRVAERHRIMFVQGASPPWSP